jgi:hypothetical protein
MQKRRALQRTARKAQQQLSALRKARSELLSDCGESESLRVDMSSDNEAKKEVDIDDMIDQAHDDSAEVEDSEDDSDDVNDSTKAGSESLYAQMDSLLEGFKAGSVELDDEDTEHAQSGDESDDEESAESEQAKGQLLARPQRRGGAYEGAKELREEYRRQQEAEPAVELANRPRRGGPAPMAEKPVPPPPLAARPQVTLSAIARSGCKSLLFQPTPKVAKPKKCAFVQLLLRITAEAALVCEFVCIFLALAS